MYLLDSSAWLIHLFGENGLHEVNDLFLDDETVVCISALSLVEVYARLKHIGKESEWPHVLSNYQLLFSQIIPVDAEIAQQAILLRTNTPQRIPTVDALIAATAMVNNLTLVHRDPHLGGIPTTLLQQILLPEK